MSDFFYYLPLDLPFDTIVIVIIYLLSYFCFYVFRNNKYSPNLPFLSILWFPVLLIPNTWDYLFPGSGIVNVDLLILLYGGIGLPLGFLFTSSIPFLFFDKKPHTYTNSSRIQVLLISFLPVFMLISYLYYYSFGFLPLEPLELIILIFIDKIIIVRYQYFFKQTILKILVIPFFLYYGPFRIIGEIIILATDCLIGYVVLQASRDKELKELPQKIRSKFSRQKHK